MITEIQTTLLQNTASLIHSVAESPRVLADRLAEQIARIDRFIMENKDLLVLAGMSLGAAFLNPVIFFPSMAVGAFSSMTLDYLYHTDNSYHPLILEHAHEGALVQTTLVATSAASRCFATVNRCFYSGILLNTAISGLIAGFLAKAALTLTSRKICQLYTDS